MQKVKLTQGKYAIIDDEDFPEINNNSWCFSDTGYAKRGTKSKGKTTVHYMHRQLLAYPDGYVDHINGNKLDNRRSNLRVVNQSINGHNRLGLNKNNTSGFKGIYFDKKRNKYVAEIWSNYTKKSRRFTTLTEARLQRREWEAKLCSNP